MSWRHIPFAVKSQIPRLYHEGVLRLDIAERLGISDKTVTRELTRVGTDLFDGPHGNAKYHLNRYVFDQLLPETNYWLGFITADGSIDTLRNRLRIGLSRRDEEHLEKLKGYLQYDGPLYYDVRAAGNGRKHPSCQLHVGCRYLIRRLHDLGLTDKCPQRIPHIDLLYDRDFWRGVIDGDGGVYIYRYARFTQYIVLLAAWSGLADCFAEFCRSLGLKSRTRRSRNIYDVRLKSTNARRLAAYLYQPGDVTLSRKAKVAAEMTSIGITAEDSIRLRQQAGYKGAVVSMQLQARLSIANVS